MEFQKGVGKAGVLNMCAGFPTQAAHDFVLFKTKTKPRELGHCSTASLQLL